MPRRLRKNWLHNVDEVIYSSLRSSCFRCSWHESCISTRQTDAWKSSSRQQGFRRLSSISGHDAELGSASPTCRESRNEVV